MDLEEQETLIVDALAAALSDEWDDVHKAMRALGDGEQWNGLSSAVFSWVSLVHNRLGVDAAREQGVVVDSIVTAYNMETGEYVSIEDVPGITRGRIMAMRLFAAIGSEQLETARDLFIEAINNEYCYEVVMEVLDIAVEVLRPIMMRDFASRN